AEVTGFPCFVKPSNLGSSVGISRVTEAAAMPAALDEAARYDRKIVVERAVQRPREVEVSVLGNDAPEASLPGEITYDAEWYDYATKYVEGQARITVPAPIGPALTARVRETAVAAFRAIDASGMARDDLPTVERRSPAKALRRQIRMIVIAGGGTGGHTSPGLAVAAALRERGLPCAWIGSRTGLEARRAPEVGIAYHAIRTGKLRRALAWQNVPDVCVNAPAGVLQAWRLLRRLRPRVVFATGGFVALPV